MSCHDFQHKLALLVGEELEVNEAIAARRHTAQCPACREALQQLDRQPDGHARRQRNSHRDQRRVILAAVARSNFARHD